MRVLVERYLSHVAAIVSPGIDELRWPAPVRPGDVLRVRVTVEAATPSRSKPDRGLVRTFIEALNQRGEVVLSMQAMNLMLRRDGAQRRPERVARNASGQTESTREAARACRGLGYGTQPAGTGPIRLNAIVPEAPLLLPPVKAKFSVALAQLRKVIVPFPTVAVCGAVGASKIPPVVS